VSSVLLTFIRRYFSLQYIIRCSKHTAIILRCDIPGCMKYKQSQLSKKSQNKPYFKAQIIYIFIFMCFTIAWWWLHGTAETCSWIFDKNKVFIDGVFLFNCDCLYDDNRWLVINRSIRSDDILQLPARSHKCWRHFVQSTASVWIVWF
jgi:uncharacterized membrane protein (DUF106 family)